MALRDDNVLRLSNGRRLGYAEYGDTNGDPVFLFHGNPGSRLSWGLLPGSPFRSGLQRTLLPFLAGATGWPQYRRFQKGEQCTLLVQAKGIFWGRLSQGMLL